MTAFNQVSSNTGLHGLIQSDRDLEAIVAGSMVDDSRDVNVVFLSIRSNPALVKLKKRNIFLDTLTTSSFSGGKLL